MSVLDTQPGPAVSVCVPAFNGADTARRCLDSILSQEFGDFEVVVSDNASHDATPAILAEYAARDARVRVSRTEQNVGRVANFSRAFAAARGRYFCWVGIDDWLEPRFLARTVAALEADPEAILATSDFTLESPASSTVYGMRGETLESDRATRRYSRILTLYHLPNHYFDPMHGLIRRAAVHSEGQLLVEPYEDWVLTAELALRGRSLHLAEVLYHREAPPELPDVPNDESPGTVFALGRRLTEIVRAAGLPALATQRCHLSTARFLAIESFLRIERVSRHFRRSQLGLTRARLRRILGRMA